MAGEAWQKISVEELILRGVLAINDGYRVRNSELGPAGIPFVRGGDIGDGTICTKVEDHILPQFADRVQSKLTRPFDVAFIAKGTVGRVGILHSAQPSSVFAPQVCYWRSLDTARLEPRFLFYLLRSREFQDNLDAVKTHGSMVADYVSMTDQRHFKLTVPPPREQKAIAATLGALDDKIELNRRMNATLETMVRVLFQSWFVDFDPVRAKLDGRQPAGLDEVAAALLPANFQNSETGHIPQGWTAGTLGGIATNPRRGAQPSEIAPNTPYIALEHMPRRCIALGDWNESADVASGKSAFKKGDILFGKLRPYFHKVGVAPLDGVCSTDILTLAPKSPEWFGFLLGHVSSDELIRFTDQASTGTKMPRTNWNDISSFKVALPPKSLAAAFTKLIQPMVERMIANLHQSRTLATLRDKLLPKLLSGDVTTTIAGLHQ